MVLSRSLLAVGPTPRFESVGSLLAIPGGVPDEYLTWNEDGQAFIVDDISIGEFRW